MTALPQQIHPQVPQFGTRKFHNSELVSWFHGDSLATAWVGPTASGWLKHQRSPTSGSVPQPHHRLCSQQRMIPLNSLLGPSAKSINPTNRYPTGTGFNKATSKPEGPGTYPRSSRGAATLWKTRWGTRCRRCNAAGDLAALAVAETPTLDRAHGAGTFTRSSG
jgi:hypothetical protein